MSHLVVNLPAIRRSIRNLKSATVGTESKEATSAERTRKYRERLRNDKDRLEKVKQVKQEQNRQYKEHIKQKRQGNASFDELLKGKQREWKRNSRKRKAAEAKQESAKTAKVTQSKRRTKQRKEASIRKSTERIRKQLPNTPTRWMKTLQNVLKNASPRKQQMISQVNESECHDTNHIEEVLDLHKVGRPSKQNEHVKRKLAYIDKAEKGAKKWRNSRYRRRKLKQNSPGLTKPSLYKARWQEKVTSFLENHSRVMPNKKDTVIMNGKSVAKRHLLCSKKELFKRFKKENEVFSRKYTTFRKMIPKNYRCLNLSCRRVCVCLKDYNLEQQIKALNKKAQEKSVPDITNCTIRELSDLTVCPFDRIPSRSCIDRKCANCGVDSVKNLYESLLECCSETETVKYHQWEQTTEKYKTRTGEVKKSNRWIQSEKKVKVGDVVDSVAQMLEYFTAHLFRSDYQHRVETEIMSEIPLDQCIVVMDFSENISLKPQDEIESSHWTHKQVTLHPIYIVRHAADSTEEKPVVIKESLIILSNHLTHNADAVFAYTEQLLVHLRNNPGPKPVKVLHRFSDNCAAQYKCKKAFEHLITLNEKHSIEIVYHYTESGHGKGPSDGLGAGIKKRIERLILGGKLINNAYQTYLALIQNETVNNNQTIIYVPSKRIKVSAPKKGRVSKTIPGTQSFHMVRQWGPGILICSDLGCSCQVCITAEEGPCLFAQYRQPEKYFSLKDGKVIPRSSQTRQTRSPSSPANMSNTCSTRETSTGDGTVLQASMETHAENVARHDQILNGFKSNIADKGWRLHGRIPEDGNCFFWSISDQLDMVKGQSMTHRDLRHSVVKHIQNLDKSGKAELSSFLTTDISTYVADIGRDGAYADHMCISMISKALSLTIRVVQAEHPDIIEGAGYGSTELVIGYIEELQHYVSLEHVERYLADDFVAVRLTSRRRKVMYVAKVLKVDEEVQLRFLQESNTKAVYTWPRKEDLSWQPTKDILIKLTTPTLAPGRGLQLTFLKKELDFAATLL